MFVQIPASELRAGLQTYVEDARRGMISDVKLLHPFPTSFKFPHIAWEAERGTGKHKDRVKVVYSPCSKVWIAT
jgi:hypothetical protein